MLQEITENPNFWNDRNKAEKTIKEITDKKATVSIIEDLKESGYLIKSEDLEHEVQVHERCGKEVEYSVMKQWFIDIMNHKKDFLKKYH